MTHIWSANNIFQPCIFIFNVPLDKAIFGSKEIGTWWSMTL